MSQVVGNTALATLAQLARHESRVVLLVMVLFACNRQASTPPPPPQVTVVQPIARMVTEWDEYTARLDAVESVEVRPRVSGYLQSIHFQDGATVHTGDLLFLIDPRPYEAALRHAEADLALAKSRLALAQKNFARGLSLIQNHAISEEEADIRESTMRQAEASIEEAQATIDTAKLDVEFTHVTAPISGRIGRKLVTEGNLITGGVGTQGTLLTTIVSLDPIYAYFDTDEGSYLKYTRLARSGQRSSSRDNPNFTPAAVWTMIEQWVPVWVGLGDEEGFPREGEMDFVDNQFDLGTGTIVGRAVLPNPDLTLTPGLFARLRLPGSGMYQALLIPDQAVGSDQAQKFVFVVNAENTVEYRAVQTGSLYDGLRIVRAGLTADDWVIFGGTQRARNGLVVDPQRQAIAQATPSPSPAAATRTADTASTPVSARR